MPPRALWAVPVSGMRIWRVVVIEVVVMMAVVTVVMVCLEPAHASAKIDAMGAVLNGSTRRARAFTFRMMMVTFLRQADLGFETQDLIAVFAHRTVHGGIAIQDFNRALGKCFDDLRMVVEVSCFNKFNVGMALRRQPREPVDPVNQDAAEQEIRKHDDAAVAKSGDMVKAGLNQGKGHTGVADLTPAKSHPLPQETGDFRDVGIGVGI